MPNKITFSKLPRTSAEHINEWQNRGLLVSDVARAEHYLNFISYYRLSAYTIPFQMASVHANHQFKPNTCFEDILNLYIFDRELRLLVMDAVERIEVAVRTQLCNIPSLTANSGGAFWYLDTQHFRPDYAHMKLLADIERQCLDEQVRLNNDIRRIDKLLADGKIDQTKHGVLVDNAQKENALRHYVHCYNQPKLPPCWVMMEYLTWGQLSHLYAGLESSTLRNAIATNLGVTDTVLISWLRSFNHIRNICAHHSRLWNKEFGVSLKIPKSGKIKWLDKPPVLASGIKYELRIYSILVALQSLLYTVSPNSEWAKRLQALLNKYPSVSKVSMGIPNDWDKDPFWHLALK